MFIKHSHMPAPCKLLVKLTASYYYSIKVDNGSFAEDFIICYDKAALELVVRGASSLGWSVYDLDRKQWLCGSLEQLTEGT